MGLTKIEYGSLASSKILNDNFNFLETEISDLAENLTNKTANFSSQVATLNFNVENLLKFKQTFIQTGMIIPTVIPEVPLGFLLCDGSELNVEDYKDLYDVIGKTYGSSDSTKFCLPDLRDKTLWGNGENELGVYLDSKLPNIKGTFRLAGTEGSSSLTGAFTAGKKGGYRGGGHEPNAYNPLMTFDASLYNPEKTVYSDDCTIVQPPALVMKFIIKY